MKHYTKYENTNISIEVSCYEKYTHDNYCRKNQLTGELVTPFRVAYIDMTTETSELGTKTDKITATVDIAMIDNIVPELVFKVVDIRANSYLSQSYIDEVLKAISEGIKYNDITWLNNMDFSNVNSGIPISPLSANYS
jgi:nicotinate-nucleotide pyrophosphorylase